MVHDAWMHIMYHLECFVGWHTSHSLLIIALRIMGSDLWKAWSMLRFTYKTDDPPQSY